VLNSNELSRRNIEANGHQRCRRGVEALLATVQASYMAHMHGGTESSYQHWRQMGSQRTSSIGQQRVQALPP